MVFMFMGLFTIGFQAVVWVYPSEILPLRLRAKGSALSTAANWICNYIVVQLTPVAISTIGFRTYVIFGVVNAIFVPIVYFTFPETKGLSLEEIDELFSPSSLSTRTS
ncbi:Sugar transporter STL1 OS=Saccharomyces cerevisiae (strain ATCC 204508 / S288c) GN=STL1 PE=1 SV=2 [Rhizoctonia solani AG-1 IB]|uniref:Sugar transporter STL1 n=1 Tax=Thanatephorus cucumeris (strain AG1-IB / isolate 7/3/14) TaxID=1108050 RepID=A0A0B7FGB0_THACB|nr:Sugar transporter STL1 OS=Saccharomyces cerevisiae (strain ATCC 204508 / S288c) GN=STL1 PE=1 SV=2 [Rhizoctonia solani AG-1 IB]